MKANVRPESHDDKGKGREGKGREGKGREKSECAQDLKRGNYR